jgi:hypothetical protein
MSIKIFISAALALFFIGFGASVVAVTVVEEQDQTLTVANQQGVVKDTPTQQTQPETKQATPEPTKPSTPTATKPSTPAPAPVATPKPVLTCGNGGSCTTAQVATHNSASNCWGIYAGKVYNLTSYVPKHDGGSAAFNSTSCGTDMTKYLNGSSGSGGVKKHSHSQKAYNILNSYYIANLQ